MPRRPRWHKPDAAYCEVQRTVDRQFFFAPNEAIRQIIGASIGRAQRMYPVKLYWIDFNINHKQSGKAALSDSAEHIENLTNFDQLCNSLIARGINKYLQREGGMFSSRNRSAEAIDDMSLENQLYYAVTNPAKDNLVDKMSHWKGFSSYEQLATGKVEKFSYINRTAWHQAGGERSKKPIGEFREWVEVKLSHLPSWEGMSEHKRQSRFRREVRAREQEYREERARFGNRPMGPKKLAKLDPRDRPKRPPKNTGKQPICHSSTVEGRDEYKKQFRDFLELYYYASMYWMRGIENVPFPPGSYKAPLIRVAS